MLDQLSRFTILKLSFKESMLEHQSEGKAKPVLLIGAWPCACCWGGCWAGWEWVWC